MWYQVIFVHTKSTIAVWVVPLDRSKSERHLVMFVLVSIDAQEFFPHRSCLVVLPLAIAWQDRENCVKWIYVW